MKRLVIGVVILCAAAGPVRADEGSTGWLKLDKGTRVRLMVQEGGPMREVVGRLLASDAASVTVAGSSGAQQFPREKLFHVQYLAPGRDRAKGAVIGGAITFVPGFIAGLVYGIREIRDQRGDSCDQCGLFVAFAAVEVGLVTAIPGAAVGFAIGAPGTDWRATSPHGLTVTPGGKQERGMKAELRFQFGHRSRR